MLLEGRKGPFKRPAAACAERDIVPGQRPVLKGQAASSSRGNRREASGGLPPRAFAWRSAAEPGASGPARVKIF